MGLCFFPPILFTLPAHAQTPDAAINDQLEFFGGIECGRLLDGNPLNALLLTGELANVCSRGVPAAGIGPSSSSGGNAGTPASLPGIVKERLQRAQNEEVSPSPNQTKVETGTNSPGYFVSAEYEVLNRQVTTFEDGYDSDSSRVTAGFDKQIDDKWLAGIAIDTSRQKGDFSGNGGFDTTTYGIVGFCSFYLAEDSSMDFYAGYNDVSSKRNRPASFTQLDSNGDVDFETQPGSPAVDYDFEQFNAGISFSADYSIGNFTFGPRIDLDWIETDFGTYSEDGNTGLELTYHDDKQTSLQSSIGLWSSTAISTGFGVVVLQESFVWKHEFENDQRNVDVSFTGDTRSKKFTYRTESPDRDFFELNLGFSVVLPNEIQVFANVMTILGHDFIDNYSFSAGLRRQF